MANAVRFVIANSAHCNAALAAGGAENFRPVQCNAVFAAEWFSSYRCFSATVSGHHVAMLSSPQNSLVCGCSPPDARGNNVAMLSSPQNGLVAAKHSGTAQLAEVAMLSSPQNGLVVFRTGFCQILSQSQCCLRRRMV